ncbi:hypothetical protein ACIBQX_50335 [Nonomuraea sp. NPDC049714]|jgi:hypothetical protein|uniref:hypothetical protein n=1 Tax=Nonomuraea sp. NPDC049714 TaxID=3364357 RepID=UPI0037A6829C
MADMSQAIPAESQWDLLEEYLLNGSFDATWIDTENIEEAAQRFRADPSSGILCDLDTSFDLADDDSGDTMTWIGMHSPGWSVAVTLTGWLPFQPAASSGGRRIITHHHRADLAELDDEGMLYYYDGELLGPLGALEEFRNYTLDLEARYNLGFEEMVESYLILAGRVTRRFLDRDWFTASRVLYRVPRGAWPRQRR